MSDKQAEPRPLRETVARAIHESVLRATKTVTIGNLGT